MREQHPDLVAILRRKVIVQSQHRSLPESLMMRQQEVPIICEVSGSQALRDDAYPPLIVVPLRPAVLDGFKVPTGLPVTLDGVRHQANDGAREQLKSFRSAAA